MKKERKYIAMLDDGHDYSHIEYTSWHRAGSAANRDDCMTEIIRKYGRKRARQFRIMSTNLIGG